MIDHRKRLSGVFAPVVTPFVNDELKLDDLRFNLKKLRDSSLAGYLALGSNGEFRSLDDSEQAQVLEVFAEEKGDKTVMVGTARESTRETIAVSKRAAGMGFEYVSVLTPCYFAKRMDAPTLERYYLSVADAVPVPVLIYNAPGFTGGVSVPPKIIRTLARHPNIVGMKDSSATGPAGFLKELDGIDGFHVLAGSANFFYPSLHLGASGGIISLANALPAPCCDLYNLFTAGRFEEARPLHFRLARLNSEVSGTAGVAGVKAAMNVCGYRGGQPRQPLAPVSEIVKDGIRYAIEREGFGASLTG